MRANQAANDRRYRFHLTAGEYAELVDAQDGCCLLCGQCTKLVVDHCQRCEKIDRYGSVRALLCAPCNKWHHGEDRGLIFAHLLYLDLHAARCPATVPATAKIAKRESQTSRNGGAS